VRNFFIFPIIIFLISPLTPGGAETFLEKQKNFPLELYKRGRYFDSIAEARRLQLFYKHEGLNYFIYSAYFRKGEYGTVINNYQYRDESAELKLPAALLVSRSYFEIGNMGGSAGVIENYTYEDAGSFHLDLFNTRIDPFLYADDFQLMKREISIADPFLADDYNFIRLRKELLARESITSKSPTGAAVMSALLPGAGQVYSGYYSAGLLSFISVAAFLAGGVHYKKDGNDSRGGVLLFFSGLFYAGNIYGAYNAASLANDGMLSEYRRSVNSVRAPYDPDRFYDIEKVFR